MRTIFLFLFLTASFILISGVQFHLGRSKGGNLGGPGIHEGDLPSAKWFKQKLDHSNPMDERTWMQSYYVNDSFYDYNQPGPVFLMIGGEGPADPRWMVQGSWITYAEKFKALCVNLEHRYYGKSHPTENISTNNLQYLSSTQALADLANFITSINEKYKLPSDVMWVAFGGSYPGSLAAWLRLKYPHLVSAAVSSSGPLLAKVNFMEYFKVVVDAIREKTGGDECVNEMKNAREVEILMQSAPKLIEKEFRLQGALTLTTTALTYRSKLCFRCFRPWHRRITKSIDSKASAVYIQGTANCADMYPPSVNDSEKLTEGRLEIKEFLVDWIGLPDSPPTNACIGSSHTKLQGT